MSKINVLLVGLGNIGYQYDQNSKYIQTHFKAINYNKNYNLIGIIEKNKKKISRFKKIHKITTQTKVSKKILKFVNLVVLAVPTNIQFKILNDFLNMGYKKNFILEKPFTTNPGEINEIYKKKRQKFFINYYRNYDDKLISFLNKIKQKKKLKINVEYSKGFYHNFSHYLNLFIKIFGNIKKIKFNKKKRINKDLKADGRIDFKNLILNFKNMPDKYDSNFAIYQNNKLILYYMKDGTRIINKMKKYRLNPNYNYMENVYFNIYKAIKKKKSNTYDIKSHKKLINIINITNEI